jgi:glycyl-tRNA synthetase
MSLPNFDRTSLDELCLRRFIFNKSFDIYGGSSGLYDYGPVLCAIKNNFLREWREWWLFNDNISEIETTSITPEEVFIHSGHVTRFNDIMTRDTITGECIRLDKYLETVFETLYQKTNNHIFKQFVIDTGSLSLEEMASLVDKYQIKSPQGNDLSPPFYFNLMFKTNIGPFGPKVGAEGSNGDQPKVGYLRPELAQGIFMNYKRILDTNSTSKIPFGIATIGSAFRNEISPRNSLLRVREFTLAEIEYFVHPDRKYHPNYDSVKETIITAWSREAQSSGQDPVLLSIDHLVQHKIIDSQLLAYFIARTALFLQHIGILHVRFRQHGNGELAHYANDCWDAECLTSYGWVECVGIADRGNYDLTCHGIGSKKSLYAYEILPEPIIKQCQRIVPNKALLGKTFKVEAPAIIEALSAMKQHPCEPIHSHLITKDMYTVESVQKKKTHQKYVPHVIEPSFGIGRILYALLEQSYKMRDDKRRAILSLKPFMCYKDIGVVSISYSEKFHNKIKDLCNKLAKLHINCYQDNSTVSIGKKYARMDEIGIPFCITFDFETDDRVTLRERDSTNQVRLSLSNICSVIVQLKSTMITFDEL